jgi:hypothetical protein
LLLSPESIFFLRRRLVSKIHQHWFIHATVESLRPDRARGRESPRGPKPACRIGPAHFPRHQKPPFMQTPTTIRKLSVQKPEHIILLFRTILVKYRKSIKARSLL